MATPADAFPFARKLDLQQFWSDLPSTDNIDTPEFIGDRFVCRMSRTEPPVLEPDSRLTDFYLEFR